MKSAKKATRENDINDLFGSISHHPSTVPVAKTTKFSNHLLRDIFDDSFDSTKNSNLNQRQSHSVLSDRQVKNLNTKRKISQLKFYFF